VTEGPYNAIDTIKAHRRALNDYHPISKYLEAFRKIGFGTVCSFNPDGIISGTSIIASLSEPKQINKSIFRSDASLHSSFDKGSSKQTYPFSKMRAMALLKY